MQEGVFYSIYCIKMSVSKDVKIYFQVCLHWGVNFIVSREKHKKGVEKTEKVTGKESR
jgi:hypothetical protein